MLRQAVAGRWPADALLTYFAFCGMLRGTSTVQTLALQRGVHPRTIQRHVRALHAMGLTLSLTTDTPTMPTAPRLVLLKDTVAVATTAHRAAAATKDARAIARPKKAPTPKLPGSAVPDVLEYLAERIAEMPHVTFRPQYAVKERAQIKRFLEGTVGGPEAAIEIIRQVTTPATWDAARKRFRIDSDIPTPGILVGFASSLLPWLRGVGVPTRSGGAAPAPVRAPTTGREDFR